MERKGFFILKRPNGYGTVTKLSGARRRPWAVRVPARDRKGRVVQKYYGYYETQRAAMEALDQYRAQRAKLAAPAPEDLGVTLREVWELWSAKRFQKIAPGSARAYENAWNRMAALHQMPVRSIGIDQWQSVIDDLAARGKSQTVIDHTRIIMRSLSTFALERDWITKDYAQFIDTPRIAQKYERGALTEEQVAKLARMAETGNETAASALVMCYTGFRASEFLALTCASYDPKNRTLTGGMKTEAGRNRVVPVHPRIQPIIDRWYAAGGEALFTEAGAAVPYSTFHTRYIKPMMERLGWQGVTAHWFRHTCATRMKLAGCDPLAMKKILGHSSKDITDRYTHLDLDFLTREMAKVK